MINLARRAPYLVTALLASIGSPSVAAAQDLVVCGLDVSTVADTTTFQLVFVRPPDFFTVDEFGRPADAFQLFVDAQAVNAPGEEDWDTIVRGGEIHLVDEIVLREVGPPGSGGPDAGGWGTVRGSISYDLSGAAVTFSLNAFSDLNDADGVFSYRLETYHFGSWQDCLEIVGTDASGHPHVRRCHPEAADCNTNGLADLCESAGQDCTGNGTLDECEPDCNTNGTADSCDIADGASEDWNSNGVPNECEPEVEFVSIAVRSEPLATLAETISPPASAAIVPIGSAYWIEIWASNIGEYGAGLEGVYVDLSFCGEVRAIGLGHDLVFSNNPTGAIALGAVDEFGGSGLDSELGIFPSWVRMGWIELRAHATAPSCQTRILPSETGVTVSGRGIVPWNTVTLNVSRFAIFDPAVMDRDGDRDVDLDDFVVFVDCAAGTDVPPAPTLPASPFNCLTAFDVEADADIDLTDYAAFQNGFGQSFESDRLDWDIDGDVDLEDFVRFADCYGGPGVAPAPALPISSADCLTAFNRDADADVDLQDYVEFQIAFGEVLVDEAGDWDDDGYVDLDDYLWMPSCMLGPMMAFPGGCGIFDFDCDNDVDFADLAEFQMTCGP